MIGRKRIFGSSRGNSFRRTAPRRFSGPSRFSPGFLLRLCCIPLVLLLLWLYLRDLAAPTVSLSPEHGAIAPHKELLLQLDDRGTGLRRASVTVTRDGRSAVLFERDYPDGTASAREPLTLQKSGLADGPVELTVEVTDRAWFPTLRGQRTRRSITLTLDSQPPQVTILSEHHRFTQGGSGAVVYSVSEETSRSGVRVADHFFPGFRQPSGNYLALVAAPWNLAPSAFIPKVVAVDQAGNERLTGIYFNYAPRTFPTDRIPVSPAFLSNKIVPDFQAFFPTEREPLALFLRVNRELRAANLKTIREQTRQTAATPLWQGNFLRQPRAAVPGYFAQHRTYLFAGRPIDQQTHLGIDLASTAQAPVPAANHGTVVFADDLGIYGQCIIIDHGLGLHSLYGHLSSMAVKAGQAVKKGDIIGNTGTSGLAGGDHLHFDLLVGGIQVNPLEWWDAHWLEDNLDDKMKLIGE